MEVSHLESEAGSSPPLPPYAEIFDAEATACMVATPPPTTVQINVKIGEKLDFLRDEIARLREQQERSIELLTSQQGALKRDLQLILEAVSTLPSVGEAPLKARPRFQITDEIRSPAAGPPTRTPPLHPAVQSSNSQPETSSSRAPPSKASVESANRHTHLEKAHGFSPEKFATTLKVVRETLVAPAKGLVFFYCSFAKYKKIMEAGMIEANDRRGVVVNLRGPDEESCGGEEEEGEDDFDSFEEDEDEDEDEDDDEDEVESELNESTGRLATVLSAPFQYDGTCRECVLVLALPLRLLWPLTAPALGVRMSSERVVPAHIVHLNHHTLLRAYQLVPDEELSTEEEVEEEDHLKPSVNNPEAHRVEIEQPLKVLNTTNDYLNLMTAILNASPRSRRVSSSSFSSSSSSSSPFTSFPLFDSSGAMQPYEKGIIGQNLDRITIYHYTDPAHTGSILEKGLRMSTQGQGDGGIYFSLKSPASYGLGTPGFEERLIVDCFGAARMEEYKGKGRLSLVLVCQVDAHLLCPAPGGRNNACMISKSFMQVLRPPNLEDGYIYLCPRIFKGAFVLGNLQEIEGATFPSLLHEQAAQDEKERRLLDVMEERMRLLDASMAMSLQLAPLPATVPPLPPNMTKSRAVQRALKHALTPSHLKAKFAGGEGDDKNKDDIDKDESSCPEIVVCHGLGGTGKTTAITSILSDPEVRLWFDKIVWVSCGANPNIFDLQESIHEQLLSETSGEAKIATGPFPSLSPTMTLEERLTTLRSAAGNQNLLLVLDDIWDARHFELLNCIGMSNVATLDVMSSQGSSDQRGAIAVQQDSRVLASTRLSRLLTKSRLVEVPLEPLDDTRAVELLLRAAGIARKDVLPEEHALALELVALCGRLPLTLAIAGGRVAANGNEITRDIVAMLQRDHPKSSPFNRVAPGRLIEDHIIVASMSAFKGRDKKMIEACFYALAIFPEDVPIPISVFEILCPVLVEARRGAVAAAPSSLSVFQRLPNWRKKRAKKPTVENHKRRHSIFLSIRFCLQELLKHNLLKGSLKGQGVFLHDIVRDHVMKHHSPSELRALNRMVVDAILAGRPSQGYRFPEFVSASGTVEELRDRYVAGHIFHHMRAALRSGEEPPEEWLVFPDEVVRRNVTEALGVKRLLELSNERVAKGDSVGAAKVLWAVLSSIKDKQSEFYLDTVFTIADFLQRADNPEVLNFEMKVLNIAFNLPSSRVNVRVRWKMTNERRMSLLKRHAGSNGNEQSEFGVLRGKAMAAHNKIMKLCLSNRWPRPYMSDFETIIPYLQESINFNREAAELTDNASERNNLRNIMASQGIGMFALVMSLDAWTVPFDVEAATLEGIDFYDFKVCGAWMKTNSFDNFISGWCVVPLTLRFGNLHGLNKWKIKVVDAFEQISSAGNISSYTRERSHGLSVCFMFVFLGMIDDARDLLSAGRSEALWQTGISESSLQNSGSETEDCFKNLLNVLVMDDVCLEAKQRIPSPEEIVAFDRTKFRWFNITSLMGLAARAFLKLGRDSDAREVASLAVAPEEHTLKACSLVDSHCVLGILAAKEGGDGGGLAAAEAHFAHALRDAKRSGMPMLEVVAARDLKAVVVAAEAKADMMIDAACAKMNKTRTDLERYMRI